MTRFTGPNSCISTVGALWGTQSKAEHTAAETLADYVSTVPWFCSADQACPAFVGDIPIRADGNHLTANYSRFLAPQLRAELFADGAGNPSTES